MLLNRKVEYALMALTYLDQKTQENLAQGQPEPMFSAKKIADELKTPQELTARILQTLSQRHILESTQGAHGGYRLKTNLANLSVLQLIEFLDSTVAIVRCQEKEFECEIRESCNIYGSLNALYDKVHHLYANTDLLEIIRRPSGQRDAGHV